MSKGANLVAMRYVDALFELAEQGNLHDKVKADLLNFAASVKENTGLDKILHNPLISRGDSEKIIGDVLAKIKVCDLTTKFFALLARQRRLDISLVIVEKYLEKLAKRNGELTARVTSASALNKQQIEEISKTLSDSTGKKVALELSEDAALIGGLKIQIGSKVLDNSIASKLARMKDSLTGKVA